LLNQGILHLHFVSADKIRYDKLLEVTDYEFLHSNDKYPNVGEIESLSSNSNFKPDLDRTKLKFQI